MERDPALHRIELLDSAARFIAAGVHLFHCGPNKKPLTKTGFKAATTDLDVIRRWLAERPDAMLAARTGGVSGFFVFDLDRDAVKGLDGTRWLAELGKQFGALPVHAIARTPRGGRHHYFKYPTNRIVKCSAGKIASGVDVRGDDGYVIVPPSVSAVGEYSWEVSPWEVSNVV